MIDDITPLRQASAEIASSEAHLYTPAVSWRERGAGGFGGGGAVQNVAFNPPAGAVIDYYLSSAPSQPMTLQILNHDGNVVRQFTHTSEEGGNRGNAALPAHAGLNRFVWNFREDGPKTIPGLVVMELQGGGGPLVPPGTYQVKLVAAEGNPLCRSK